VTTAILLWIGAANLVIAGIFAVVRQQLIRQQLIRGIGLLVVGLLVGPAGSVSSPDPRPVSLSGTVQKRGVSIREAVRRQCLSSSRRFRRRRIR